MTKFGKYLLLVVILALPIASDAQFAADTVKMGGVLREAVIVDDQVNIKPSEAAVKLDPLVFDMVPSVFGNRDVLKIVQYLPGINNNSEGNVGISIRGGDYDETMVLFDKIPLYSVGNLKGFVSVFNADIVGGTYVYKSTFPTEYGGRLSGIVDVYSKEVFKEEVDGSISVGTMMSAATITGKVKESTSFILSGRVSYLDLLVLPIYGLILSEDGGINHTAQVDGVGFCDMNGVVEHRFNDKHSLKSSLYYGNNKNKFTSNIRENTYIFNGDDVTTWGNLGGNVIWNYNYNVNHKLSNYLYFSRYAKKNRLYQKSVTLTVMPDSVCQMSSLAKQSIRNNVADIAVGTDAEFTIGNHTLDYGWKYSIQFAKSIITNSNKVAEYVNNEEFLLWDDKTSADFFNSLSALSLYTDDEFSIGNWLDMGVGMRFTLYAGGKMIKLIPEPRVRIALFPFPSNKNLSFKLSYSKMSQGVHQLMSGGIAVESDLWVLANNEIPVSTSNQYAGGIYWDIYLRDKKCSLGIEGYYRNTKNVIDYMPGATYSNMENVANVVEVGAGKSYGIEGFILKGAGLTTWSVSYTWGKSFNRYDSINRGEWFYSKQDVRHNLSCWISQKLGKHFDVSASFVYKSGRYITLEDMKLPVFINPARSVTNIFVASGGVNNYKLADYHRLDLSVNYHIFHKVGKSTVNLTINNVYNHHNTYKLWLTELSDNNGYMLNSLCLFPFMPSVSYSFEF